jgi:hypothetical protein
VTSKAPKNAPEKGVFKKIIRKLTRMLVEEGDRDTDKIGPENT